MVRMTTRIFMSRLVELPFGLVELTLILLSMNLQINIPEMSGRNPLWRYFSKINIDALTDMTRWRRDTQTKDETSTFSDIRKRFGHHRKSIKNKMKKLYTRSHSDSIDAIDDSSKVDGRQPQHATCSPTSSSDGGKSSPEANQNATDEQFRKRDRHLFGSMLKKSRTSFCFEDSAPKKKLIMASAALKRRMCADKVKIYFRINSILTLFFSLFALFFSFVFSEKWMP